jgi:hypothetical protein
MTKETNRDIYAAELRTDQWDLIVLALQHIRAMTTGSESSYGVDKLGRLFLRRRCDETVKDIQSQVPANEPG